MIEPEKITIVEGPTPTFELVLDPWVLAMSEGPALPCTGRCMLRTMNGPELVERCQTAWREGRDACLEYRSLDGVDEEALILAVRSWEVDAGQVLSLWLRLNAWPDDIASDEGSNTLGIGGEDLDDFI